MIGLMVVNSFLKGDKYDEIHGILVNAFASKNIKLVVLTNAQLMVMIDQVQPNKPSYDFVLFWDKDIELCRHLENMGYAVFNSSFVIDVCDDKRKLAVYLSNKGIPMPKTILAPFTYSNIGYSSYDFVDTVMSKLKFPFVVKEACGSFGQQVYLVNDRQELIRRINDAASPVLFQQLIESSFGRDVRIQVVGDKVVAAVLRTAREGEFRANVTMGGTMSCFDAPDSFVELALKTARALRADFVGVDILFGENDQPILCEVNSNAHFKNILDVTGINVAMEFADYIRSKVLL